MEITPNEMAAAQRTLEALSKEVPFKIRFKFARTIQELEKELETFRKANKLPSMQAYKDAVSIINGEDMKGKAEEKLKLFSKIKEDFKKELEEFEKLSREADDNASTKLEVTIKAIKEEDLPENITANQIVSLLPIIR